MHIPRAESPILQSARWIRQGTLTIDANARLLHHDDRLYRPCPHSGRGMSSKPELWLAALAECVPPFAIVSQIGQYARPLRERRRRRSLQVVANALCNVVAADRRYPNEVRREHPEGGRLVMDILARRCILNDAAVDPLGVVDRLGIWLRHQLGEAAIPEEWIRCVRVAVEYTAAERTYLASGRVWEMDFSLRSEIETPEASYFGVTPACTAAVPYGIGALVAW